MKKRILSICALVLSYIAIGQTVHPDYLDGAIWVNLKSTALNYPSASLNGSVKDGAFVLPSELPFKELISGHKIKVLNKPFHYIRDEKLKNILRIEIEDIYAVDDLIAALSRHPQVVYAERIPLLKKTITPNDPSYNSSTQWNLFQVNATTAWDVSLGNTDVKVAIVDDAVEITHPDLAPVIWTNTGEIPGNGIDDDNNGYVDDVNGFDVANNDNNPNPDAPVSSYDHGTHVAGISGAATNNGVGVASIGHNLTLLPVKSTNSASFVTHGYEGVLYSVAAGADVINMSWGGGGSSTTGQNIITYASNQGIVLVAAAGNDNVSSVFYPAGYPEVIAVASTTFGDSKSSFSNYGAWIDVSAPGSAIYSTVPGGGYQIKQGTSMASPMVAGLAGLMLSLNPSLSPEDVKTCILSTADDIESANPSYVGELGAGRINAFQAMNCVSATLNWAPQADFIASSVNILEGQTVTFTDLSIYNPTSWTWTFTGGTPATFNGQTPGPITYNTAGTYAVSLTVTNANGTDTETKTAYLTVNALTGCDEISNTLPADPNNVWTWGAPNGYIMGHNYTRYNRVAERFTAVGPTTIMGADFFFLEAAFVDPNTTIAIKVWDDAAGNPGAELYSETIRISEIADNITPTGFFPTVVDFDLPVAVAGANFFVGYEYAYRVGGGDTITCAASGNLTADATRPNSVWVFVNPADNPLGIPTTGWQQVSDIGTIELAMHVYPRITSAPPTAIINPTPGTVCQGGFITFDGTSSLNTVNWEWAINGTSTPYPTGSAPNVIMNNDGIHWAYMLAENYCGYYHIDSIQVTVNPTPTVTLTSSVVSDSICPGGSAVLTASGATSYSWNPGASLSCTTCPNPTATPAVNTTYTVTGTAGGCSSDTYYTLVVDNSAPIAEFLMSSDTLCEGDLVSFNGAISDGGSVFTWGLTGASPSTASGAIVEVEYPTAGVYTVDLSIENSCGQTDNNSQQIVVLSTAICTANLTENEASNVPMFYDINDAVLNIDLSGVQSEGSLYITSLAGQLVHSQNDLFGQMNEIDLKQLAPGMYMVVLSTASRTQTLKFIR